MNHTFTVTGMTCEHCEKAIIQAIRKLDAQAQVRIDRSAQKIEVQSAQTRPALAQAIEDAGYPVVQ